MVDQFLTDTAREADIVLPAKTMFEQTDVINAYWHPYIQIKEKVIEPPGEVRPESEIYRELAERLGIPKNPRSMQFFPGARTTQGSRPGSRSGWRRFPSSHWSGSARAR